MAPRPDDPLSRWLDAEGAGRDQEAEAALAELMADLPRWAPPAGFAQRVMLALPAGSGSFFASRWTRATLAFALSAAALVLALVPEVLAALLGLVSPGRVMTLAARSVTDAAELLAGLLGAGLDLLLRVEPLGRAVALLLSAPQVAASLACCALVSTLSFYLLKSLLTKRSWSHVHPV